MTADPSEMLKANDLGGALAALQERVRAAPADAKLRIFLFQLLCVRGDWSRAIRQLKLCAELDAAALPMAQAYREALVCEVHREKVFAGTAEPTVFGEPGAWVAGMLEALRAQASGEAARAADLRAHALEAAPATPGQADGAPFAWIADADMRMGPMLEAVVNGRYFWIPFAAMRRVAFDPPEDLRDAVWTPATLTLATGSDVVALIPTRYVGTTERGGDAERLARATRWIDVGADVQEGLGQRLLATDADDHPIMDLRLLEFAEDQTASPEATDG